MEIFIVSDPYNSIEKKNCYPFTVVLYLSVYISLCQLGGKGLVLISVLVNGRISPLSQNAPELKT